MMKELETVAPLTGSKKNRTAILSVSERGAKLGQRIKSLVAPYADCFEKDNRPSGGEAIYFDSLKNHIGQIFKDYDQVLCIMALGIVAVSYTHLDVYKRQQEIQVTKKMAGASAMRE